MRRRVVGVLVVIVVTLVVGVRSSPAAQPRLTKGPYLQNPTPTGITVQWETDRPGDGVVTYRPARGGPEQTVPGTLFETVRVAKLLEAPKPSSSTEEDEDLQLPSELPYPYHAQLPKRQTRAEDKDAEKPSDLWYLYRARLSDLQPGTEYAYTVDVAFDGASATSGKRMFRTWPERADRARFIIYGDTRTQPDKHRLLTRQFNRHHPDFIVHVGDMVDDGNRYRQWGPQFFEPLAEVLDRIPMFMVLGNHENGARNLLRLFDMPEGGMNYSFDFGPVHVVVLDYHKPEPEDLKWLARDLAASSAPWKVAAYHVPTFNFDGHRSDDQRTTYLPLFERYDVDLVVTGHSHHYERFVPLRRDAQPNESPITFITSGGGGAPLYGVSRSSGGLVAKAVSDYQFCLFDADARSLALRVFNGEGKQIDALDLAKDGIVYEDAYLRQVRSTEDAILAQGLRRAGMPLARSLPAEGETLSLTLKASFPGLWEPVTVTARLSDASAEHYTMRPQIVWAMAGEEVRIDVTVTARRDLTYEERDVYVLWKDDYVKVRRRFLKPNLSFSLTAKSAGFELVREHGAIEYVGPTRPGKK